MMNEKGHLCLRIAGSGAGSEAVADTILFVNGVSHLVEVKATREAPFYVRTHVRDQLNELYKVAIKNKLIPVLAVKFKRRGWKFYQVRDEMSKKLDFEGVMSDDCSVVL